MSDFDAEIEKIGDLLAKPNAIEAPAYQRAFAWTREEAGKLLEDISTSIDETEAREDGSYFLGNMLFVDRDSAPAPSVLTKWARARPTRMLEVVDGFQRLTTLTILLCVLRDLDASKGEPPHEQLLEAIHAGRGANARPRLSLRAPEEAFFDAHVRNPGATRLNPKADELSPPEARIIEVRDHFIDALMGHDAAERRRLTDFLLDRCCVVHVGTADIDRAYRMFMVLNASGKPLARDDILKATLLGGLPAGVMADCVAIWDLAKDRLGDEFASLFSHIRAMYGRPGAQIIAGVNEIAEEDGGAQHFIERVLQPAARIFDDIRNFRHEGSPQSAVIAQYLRYLGWHGFADWKPAAMLWWLRNGEDTQGLARFLRRLDRLAFGIRILAIGGSKRRRKFDAVASAVRDNADLDAANSPFEFTRQELRSIQHNLRDLHARNPSTAKHLLLRLADIAAGEPVSLSLPDDMTVEHVLPRKLSASSPWRAWFPDPDVREQCTESLGNLLLVTKAQNDRASNHDFAYKLDVYFSTPDAPVVVINQDLRGRREWRAREIKAREGELLQHIEALWKFDPAGSREQAQETTGGRRKGLRRRSDAHRDARDGKTAP
jgi:Protein of unknown function DUF262/Protein of unknown function (DUF1524)